MKGGLLIDTNLLLVMIIGGVDEGRYIEKSKRLNEFCFKDYQQLWKIAQSYDEIYITSYIATEVSNLIDLHGHIGFRVFDLAKRIFSIFKQVDTSIADDCEGEFFHGFGLTDNSIINLSKSLDVLTYDRRLSMPLYTLSPERTHVYVPFKVLHPGR